MSKGYDRFLGTWILDTSSCDYEQGAPPQSGVYRIADDDAGVLHFVIEWVDAEGKAHDVSFSGPPNGEAMPFPGGDLADAFAITLVSPRELNSSAFYRGRELMVAQRQLDDTGNAMRVVQQVRLPDGTTPTNVAIYQRLVLN